MKKMSKNASKPNKMGGGNLKVLLLGIFCMVISGQIRATGMKLTTTDWPDSVFKPSYKLMPLKEVEKHIDANGHLPNIPSEAEMIDHGIDITGIAKLQMQKIEELTLYLIAQNKKIEALTKEVRLLKSKK